MLKINYKNIIINKIKERKIIVGVIGLGYVGLPLSILFSKKSFKVYGFDTNKQKINSLKNNRSYIERIKDTKIKEMSKNSHFYNDFKKIKECDVVILCVPTPLKNDKPDLSFLRKSIISISKFLKPGQVIILESTSYPGTTREELVNKLKLSFKIGQNIFIGFSSERIDPGRNENKLYTIPKVISGCTKNCTQIISKFYSKVFKKIVKANNIETAEFSKLLENIYRAVNIGFINEMKIIADKMGVDIYDILDLAETKPYGYVRFNPGPGVGGHCIPIDPEYLYWKASKLGIKAKFIKLAAKTNIRVIKFIKYKIFKILKDSKTKPRQAKILIIGISYKKNVDDLRESSSLKLIKLLKEKKIGSICFSDPHIIGKIDTRDYKIKLKNIKLSPKAISKFDIAVIMTDHDKFDYKMIKKYSKSIVDCRGKYKTSSKIIRA